MYPENQNYSPEQQNNTPNWQNNNYKNPSSLRTKKRIYTVIQIICVIGLLISLPMLVLGIINAGSRFSQTAKTTGVITKISDDLGGMIDKSTNGRTTLANGCTIYYEFNSINDKHDGFSHNKEYCNKLPGDKIPITYDSTNPSRNSIMTDTSFYAVLFWLGLALMMTNITVIIVVSSIKRHIVYAQQSLN